MRTAGEKAMVAFDLWRGSMILVAVDANVLHQALGLSRGQLLRAEASAVILTDAILDTEVQPHA
jgi:hypothetical protein